MDKGFLHRLDAARERAGVSFVLTSSIRCAKHNATIKGSSLISSHLVGRAVDIQTIDGHTRMRAVIGLVEVGFDRMGWYPAHVHVDGDHTKPHPRGWHRSK